MKSWQDEKVVRWKADIMKSWQNEKISSLKADKLTKLQKYKRGNIFIQFCLWGASPVQPKKAKRKSRPCLALFIVPVLFDPFNHNTFPPQRIFISIQFDAGDDAFWLSYFEILIGCSRNWRTPDINNTLAGQMDHSCFKKISLWKFIFFGVIFLKKYFGRGGRRLVPPVSQCIFDLVKLVFR